MFESKITKEKRGEEAKFEISSLCLEKYNYDDLRGKDEGLTFNPPFFSFFTNSKYTKLEYFKGGINI